MRNRFGVEEKLYEGNVYANLKRINKDGLIVAPVAYGLQRRVECLDMESSEEERSFWNGYFFSGDGIAEHPDGSFKIVFDAFAHPEFKQWGKMQKEMEAAARQKEVEAAQAAKAPAADAVKPASK